MGPQDPKDVARDTARDLSGLVGELAALKGVATHWLTDPEYAALRHRLEAAHAAAEAALVQALARTVATPGYDPANYPLARIRAGLASSNPRTWSREGLPGPSSKTTRKPAM